MAMDDEDGLSFGYQLPADVTSALTRAFHKGAEAGPEAGLGDGLGPFVYHAEGLTFAFVEHEGSEKGGRFSLLPRGRQGIPLTAYSSKRLMCALNYTPSPNPSPNPV